jgi:hypothetical protein
MINSESLEKSNFDADLVVGHINILTLLSAQPPDFVVGVKRAIVALEMFFQRLN